MRIAILTEGGRRFGFGHVARCIALYQAFNDKGALPQFIVNGDKSILEFLKGKKYIIFNWVKEKGKSLQNIDNVDGIVIDSYTAPKSLYCQLSQLFSGKIVMIDDFKRIDYPSGIVVNPSIYGAGLNYPGKQGIAYLLGKDYIILRKEFCRPPLKQINRRPKLVMITFGGINHLDLAERIACFLKNNFNICSCIVGSGKNRLSAGEMLKLMLKADICISGGGQTTYELARVGVPSIGICFADNQLLNLRYWQKKGFIKYAGSCDNKNLLQRIVDGVTDLLSFKQRLIAAKIGRNSVDGQGAERITEALLARCG